MDYPKMAKFDLYQWSRQYHSDPQSTHQGSPNHWPTAGGVSAVHPFNGKCQEEREVYSISQLFPSHNNNNNKEDF